MIWQDLRSSNFTLIRKPIAGTQFHYCPQKLSNWIANYHKIKQTKPHHLWPAQILQFSSYSEGLFPLGRYDGRFTVCYSLFMWLVLTISIQYLTITQGSLSIRLLWSELHTACCSLFMWLVLTISIQYLTSTQGSLSIRLLWSQLHTVCYSLFVWWVRTISI